MTENASTILASMLGATINSVRRIFYGATTIMVGPIEFRLSDGRHTLYGFGVRRRVVAC
jgi:hypothetical protein